MKDNNKNEKITISIPRIRKLIKTKLKKEYKLSPSAVVYISANIESIIETSFQKICENKVVNTKRRVGCKELFEDVPQDLETRNLLIKEI